MMTNKRHSMFSACAAVLMTVLFAGCDGKPYFSDFKPVASEGWHADSVACFTIDAEDTLTTYQMILQVRHNDVYPYQNMWVFVDKTYPDNHTRTDTIEFYLADQRGRWLGGGMGNVKLMPVLIEPDWRFDAAGRYDICVRHAMRTDLLRGVQDIGLELYVKE